MYSDVSVEELDSNYGERKEKERKDYDDRRHRRKKHENKRKGMKNIFH